MPGRAPNMSVRPREHALLHPLFIRLGVAPQTLLAVYRVLRIPARIGAETSPFTDVAAGALYQASVPHRVGGRTADGAGPAALGTWLKATVDQLEAGRVTLLN